MPRKWSKHVLRGFFLPFWSVSLAHLWDKNIVSAPQKVSNKKFKFFVSHWPRTLPSFSHGAQIIWQIAKEFPEIFFYLAFFSGSNLSNFLGSLRGRAARVALLKIWWRHCVSGAIWTPLEPWLMNSIGFLFSPVKIGLISIFLTVMQAQSSLLFSYNVIFSRLRAKRAIFFWAIFGIFAILVRKC